MYYLSVHGSDHALAEEEDLMRLAIDSELVLNLLEVHPCRMLFGVFDEKIEAEERLFMRIFDCFLATATALLELVSSSIEQPFRGDIDEKCNGSKS